MHYGYIYKIQFPNGKHYIGITSRSLEQRQIEHKRCAKNGDTKYLYNALRKYNMEDTLELVEIDTADNKEELCEKEMGYILMYNSSDKEYGYNGTIGGEGTSGYSFTEEQRKNVSKSQLHRFDNPEARQKHSESQKTRFENPEEREKSSIRMKQRSLDNPNIGIQHSICMKQLYHNNPSKKKDMSKLKIQQNKDNPDMRKQQSELKLMRFEDKCACEERKKISKTVLTQWQDPEKRKKIMDEKRKRFGKPFDVYKNGILIDSCDYVPDCAFKMFGTRNGGKISAVLNGRSKSHKGYVFKYK